MDKYTVKDSCGAIMGVFTSYKAASTYKFTYGNYNWTITEE